MVCKIQREKHIVKNCCVVFRYIYLAWSLTFKSEIVLGIGKSLCCVSVIEFLENGSDTVLRRKVQSVKWIINIEFMNLFIR